MAAEIEKAIRQNAGLIVDKMLQAEPEGDEADDDADQGGSASDEGPDADVAVKKGARAKR